MKERELLIRSVVNLMLAVFARSVTEGQLLGPEVTVRWVACFVCGVSCRSRAIVDIQEIRASRLPSPSVLPRFSGSQPAPSGVSSKVREH